MGQRIKVRRKKLKMSRPELVKRSGIPYSTLADIENERQKSSTALHIIAKVLQTTPEWLSDEAGPEEAGETMESPLTLREQQLLAAFRDAGKDLREAIERVAGLPLPFAKDRSNQPEKKHRAR